MSGNERSAIWVAILRMSDEGVVLTGVMSLKEILESVLQLDLRMRYNPDIRLITMRLPAGTKRKQVVEAFGHLSTEEVAKMYNLPTRPLR